jgi:hypothetical protein
MIFDNLAEALHTYIRRIHGVLGREITKDTVIYGTHTVLVNPTSRLSGSLRGYQVRIQRSSVQNQHACMHLCQSHFYSQAADNLRAHLLHTHMVHVLMAWLRVGVRQAAQVTERAAMSIKSGYARLRKSCGPACHVVMSNVKCVGAVKSKVPGSLFLLSGAGQAGLDDC